MAATARAGAKSPPRRPGKPATAAAPPPSSGSGPLRFTTAADEPGEREELFSIDGKPYTIPCDPPASIGINAQEVLAAERETLISAGLDAKTATMTAMGFAQRHILRSMLGPEGYEALLGYRQLTRADLRRLMEICSERAYAALEDEESPNR